MTGTRDEGWSPLARVYNPLQAGSIDGTDTVPHDRAIWRAMNATYQPSHLVKGDPDCTLFVARLHPDTSEETLEKTFSKYGYVHRVRLVRDAVTGFSKRYAFIEYEDEETCRRAFKAAQRIQIDDMNVFVDKENERTLKGWIPRRLGGGFGGKKESGQLRFGGRDRPFRKPILVTREVTESAGSRGVLKLHDGSDQSGGRDRDSEGGYSDYRRRRRSRSRDRSDRDQRDYRGRDQRDRRDYRDYRGDYRDRDRDRYRDRRRSRSRSRD